MKACRSLALLEQPAKKASLCYKFRTRVVVPPDIRIRFGRAIRRLREKQRINQEGGCGAVWASPHLLQRR
jgi:hypothetical protein